MLKIDRKEITNTSKLIKQFVRCFFIWSHSSSDAQPDYIWLGRDEPDERSPLGGKIIRRLLLMVTVADPQ